MASEKRTLACLGPKGSLSHEAAQKYYPQFRIELKESLEDVFDSVYRDEYNFALMPIENSTEGIIALTYHKLVEQGFNPKIRIQAEKYHPIVLNLAASTDIALDNLNYVHTKEEAWGQCRDWISRNLPRGVQFISESSTSKAARVVGEMKETDRGAITGSLAIDIFKLKLMVRMINDFKTNTTRFFLIGKRPYRRNKNHKKEYKATLAMVLLDQIGAISEAFEIFTNKKVNVRTVKVCPIRAPAILTWKDWFFIDVKTDDDSYSNVVQAIEALRSKEGLVLTIRELGRYICDEPDDGTRAKKPTPPPSIPSDFDRSGSLSLEDLIAAGEASNIEFKSSLRWNIRDSKMDRQLEFVVVKTIVGFMNAKGGILLIGISDHGEILGIENDIKTLSKQSRDGFELHLRNIIQSNIGTAYSHLIETQFFERDKKIVYAVIVQPGPKPMWIQQAGKNEFFVRSGNQTKPLDNKETTEYIKLRWG